MGNKQDLRSEQRELINVMKALEVDHSFTNTILGQLIKMYVALITTILYVPLVLLDEMLEL